MNTLFKSSILSIASIFAVITTSEVLAQSLQTRQEITKYAVDYIPSFQSSIVGQSGNKNLGNIAVNIDFQSFGDNKQELENAVRQMLHFKGALLFLNKEPTSRSAIETKIKSVKIALVANAKDKRMTFKNGVVTLTSNSFDLGKFHSSEDIKSFLLKSL